jgi:transcriptional regulator with XRE-family HTH domain
MIIGDRIRVIREQKKLSQDDIQKRTGLERYYISRVEKNYTVPSIETLEKLARALEIPLYQFFYEGQYPPALPNLFKQKTAGEMTWGDSGKERECLMRFRQQLAKMREKDRKLLFLLGHRLSGRSKRRSKSRAVTLQSKTLV